MFYTPRKYARSTGRSLRQWRIRPLLERLETRYTPTFPIAPEMHINTTTALDQNEGDVALAPDGTAVVVWTHRVSVTNTDIRGQRYDSVGSPLGGEFVIASFGDLEYQPTVCIAPDHSFVVAWTRKVVTINNENIFAQRFSSAGAKVGGVLGVALTSTADEFEPSIACNAVGDFVVAYTKYSTPTNKDVNGRMYYANASFQKAFIVASGSGLQETPDVVRNIGATDVFAVGFRSANDVMLRQYNNAGALTATHFPGASTNVESNPSVAMDNVGNVLIGWQVQIGGDSDIEARKISAAGVMGSVIDIQSCDTSNEAGCAVTLLNTGKFLVAYESQIVCGTLAGASSVVLDERDVSGASQASSTLTGLSFATGLVLVSYDAPPSEIVDYFYLGFGALNRFLDSGWGIFALVGSVV